MIIFRIKKSRRGASGGIPKSIRAAIVAVLLLGSVPLFADQFGDALWNYGCRLGIWKNSFNPALPADATGSFQPGVDANGSDYPGCAGAGLSNNRYGMCVLNEPGTTVTLTLVNGRYEASGVAHNYSGIPTDSSLLAELFSNGMLADSTTVRWSCGANAGCPWQVRFNYADPDPGKAWTAAIRRHIEGSLVGERITTCPAMAVRLGLPPTWVFSSSNAADMMYVKAPSKHEAVFDELYAYCQESPSPTPTPSPSPTATPPPSACLDGQCRPACPANCPAPTPTPTATPAPTATSAPTATPAPPPCEKVREAPPGCSILDAIARQTINTLFRITPLRKSNAAECKKWRDEVNQAFAASTGRTCVDVQ